MPSRYRYAAWPSGGEQFAATINIGIDLSATNGAIIREVRRILRLARGAERERLDEEGKAARRTRGRPRTILSNAIYAGVVRAEVAQVYTAVKAAWPNVRRARDEAERVAVLAAAIRSAWPHRRAEELAGEALRSNPSPRQTAVLVVARLRLQPPRSVERACRPENTPRLNRSKPI